MILARRALRTSFLTWAEHALAPQGFKPAAHHRLLIKELEAVARGETRRLMVFMPPGSAKSTYSSDLFPAWYLAQKPGLNIITASNTADLAKSFSRRVRGRVRQHSKLLGYGLVREAEELWDTDRNGQYRAAGAGGTITGLRADLAVIDDPIKGREEADSELRRQRVWDWYQDDLQTRLKPGASVILVQTRWHEDDLAGRLLAHEPGSWRVVSLPMVAESTDDAMGRQPGEYLWTDDAYGYGADIEDRRARILPRTWNALYQQRPAPEDGDFFRKDWLRPVPKLPPRDSLRIFGGSDYAVTADGGDYTVHIVCGLDADNRLYLLDLWRGQTASDVWVEAFCDLVTQWRPIGWAEETGQIRAGIGPWLRRRMIERRALVAREQFPTRGDKATRAQSIRGRMALDGLYIPTDAPWRADLESEMMSFPAGKHDDQVDALGLVGQLLDRMFPATPKQPGQPPRAEFGIPGPGAPVIGTSIRELIERAERRLEVD